MAIQVHETSCAAVTRLIHQLRTLIEPSETERNARHATDSVRRIATYGTPRLDVRASILGACPRCAIPRSDLDAAKTKELVVENKDTNTAALTMDGRTGI
jgi:hypothetical protein